MRKIVPTFISAIFVAYIIFFHAAIAAEFTEEIWRGHKVIRISGTIDRGSFEKFQSVALNVPIVKHGYRILLLDSGGGSVDEALKIAQLVRQNKFHTVIPNNAECASACASIIFISGNPRTIEPFGLFGQHSCSTAGIKDGKCNKQIAEFGVRNGVSYGSIAAFVTFVPPDKIAWFTREDADGFGITKYSRELENGYVKSEPRVLNAILGKMPEAQTAWRVDFFKDGWKAFLRPYADHIREMQLNVYCFEHSRGRLFISMEINGPERAVRDSVQSIRVSTNKFSWTDFQPFIEQIDRKVTEVRTEVPKNDIVKFLREANDLEFYIDMKKPYNPMIAKTSLSGSRNALLFAANNCASSANASN
jgi:hypothetical protein